MRHRIELKHAQYCVSIQNHEKYILVYVQFIDSRCACNVGVYVFVHGNISWKDSALETLNHQLRRFVDLFIHF